MSKKDYLIRNTAQKKGRNIFVTPENSTLKYLSCGRIILDRKIRNVSANSEDQELSFICLKGEGSVKVHGKEYKMKPYDALYIPCQTSFQVSTGREFDLAEASAPSDKVGEPQFISFESVKNNPDLRMTAGGENYTREIYKLIDLNINASRLLCGVTFGNPGHWTSWLPHEHANTKEEIYLYINMPKPAFGIQMVYDDLENPDFVETVFEDDAVVISHGYHPNLSIPGYGINFVWMMAAYNPETDRDWTDMHFQEEFAGKY
ncbi:MAG: 5-deoxy-glucuronate isomerase [bacterium]